MHPKCQVSPIQLRVYARKWFPFSARKLVSIRGSARSVSRVPKERTCTNSNQSRASRRGLQLSRLGTLSFVPGKFERRLLAALCVLRSAQRLFLSTFLSYMIWPIAEASRDRLCFSWCRVIQEKRNLARRTTGWQAQVQPENGLLGQRLGACGRCGFGPGRGFAGLRRSDEACGRKTSQNRPLTVQVSAVQSLTLAK